MSDLSKIVYLSEAQYNTLKTNGTITVGGTTITYSADDLYLTPDQNIPVGGTTGQVLTKASSTDYDTAWTSLVNLVYPVGSIYMSVNSTSPQTLFGGTWEEIQARFLLGNSSLTPAGSTGGESSHILTTSELPSHNH